MEFNNFSLKNGGHEEKIKISLEDFPDDIYILLEDGFRAEFFKTAWRINKSYRHLAKKIGVSNPVMLSWKRGKINLKIINNLLDFYQLDEQILSTLKEPMTILEISKRLLVILFREILIET